MIIRQLSASFGNLKNQKLQLSSGLNVIEAPNEAGKSTWCALIRIMLFGINTSDRDKIGYLSDKTRYRPWSGASMEGSMALVWNGRSVTIERKPRGAAPMKNFSAVYTGTGEEVPGLSSETAGELLTGVSESVFDRSAFIRQSGMRVNQTADLEKRISALVSSGDESTSFMEADEKLRAWLRKRRYNKSGRLPALEARLSDTNEKLEALEKISARVADLRQDIGHLSAQKKRLHEDLVIHDKMERRATLKRIREAEASVNAAEKDVKELTKALSVNGSIPAREDLAQIRSDLAKLEQLKQQLTHEGERKGTFQKIYDKALERKAQSPLAGANLPDMMTKVEAAAEAEKTAASKSVSITGRRLFSLLLICLMAAAAALYLLIGGITLYISGAAVVLCALALVFLQRPRHKKDKELEDMLSAYGFSAVRDLQAAAEEYDALCGELNDAAQQLSNAQQSLAETQRRLKDCETDLSEKMRTVSAEPVGIGDVPRRDRAEGSPH